MTTHLWVLADPATACGADEHTHPGDDAAVCPSNVDCAQCQATAVFARLVTFFENHA